MLVRGKGAIITGGKDEEGNERRSPPLPYIEVDDTEGRVLIGLGCAVEVTEDEEVPEVSTATVISVGDTVTHGPTPTPEPVEESAETVDEVVAEADEAETVDEVVQETAEEQPSANVEPDAIAERKTTIVENFELLADDDLVKTGERAGRPKVKSLEAATGFDDLTAEEIDALWLAREQ